MSNKEWTTFAQYKSIAIGLLKKWREIDEQTAKEHLENVEVFYKKWYYNNEEVGNAVREDMRHWQD